MYVHPGNADVWCSRLKAWNEEEDGFEDEPDEEDGRREERKDLRSSESGVWEKSGGMRRALKPRTEDAGLDMFVSEIHDANFESLVKTTSLR